MLSTDTLHIIQSFKRQPLPFTLATGVFDLLHIEHLRFLTKAKALNVRLLVGIESDIRVRQIKGDQRPVNHQAIRLEQLSYLKSVDHAFVLPEDFSTQQAWVKFMQQVNPTTYAVSSHTSFLENKQKICQELGISFVIAHQFNPTFSSTKHYNALVSQD